LNLTIEQVEAHVAQQRYSVLQVKLYRCHKWAEEQGNRDGGET
jgi:hypothetical protein